jgi:hypothetical protein
VAIPHFSASIVSRGSGRSAVLSAAYRHCAKMEYEREAASIDYTRKQGLAARGVRDPFGCTRMGTQPHCRSLGFRRCRGLLEQGRAFEKRPMPSLPRPHHRLPLELSAEQNIALVRDFVEKHILAKGMVADWVYHDAPGNPHVHLMTTLRPLTDDGFGPKKVAVIGEDGQPVRNEDPARSFTNSGPDRPMTSMRCAMDGSCGRTSIWRLAGSICGSMAAPTRSRVSILSHHPPRRWAKAIERKAEQRGRPSCRWNGSS